MGKLDTRLRRSLLEIDAKRWYSFWFEKLIDIKDWFVVVFISKPRRFKESVQRVIGWIPTIWNNYDWDSHYLFEIMRYKLIRMEENIRIHGHHVGNDKTADSIKTARLLLDRICDMDYSENAVRPLERELGGWGFERSDGYIKIKYDKDLTKEQIQEYEKSRFKAYKHAGYLEKQDVEYLFKHITKYHKKWWD